MLMFFINNYQNIFDFLELEKIYNFVYKKDMFNSLALKGKSTMHIS
jgi:hypothetical protein